MRRINGKSTFEVETLYTPIWIHVDLPIQHPVYKDVSSRIRVFTYEVRHVKAF